MKTRSSISGGTTRRNSSEPVTRPRAVVGERKATTPMSQANGLISLEAGGVLFEIRYRRSRGDEGLTFDVFAEDGAQRERLLRFDCFRDQPHFHLGRIKVENIDPSEIPDASRWVLEELKSGLASFIERAGYPAIAARLDQRSVAEALSRVENEISLLKEKSP